MKTLCSFLFLFFPLATTVIAQSLHVDSTRFITGYRPGTQINYAIPTADKGMVFIGLDGLNPGGIIPFFPLDTNGENVLIGKIDSNRQISWIKVYGGSKFDEAVSACQTPDGGYAVLATTMSYDGDVTSFNTGQNLWLLRLDGMGNLLWEKCYGDTTGGSIAISVANTPDHGFILLGNSNGYGHDVPFHYGGIFTDDWIVIKTDSAGNKQWCKDLGTTGEEQPNGSILAVDNAYYLIGSTDSSNHDCNDTNWHRGVYTLGDYYMLKLDTAGNVLWDSSYGGSGADEPIYALFDQRDSTIMITGFTTSNDYMVTGYHPCPGYSFNGDMWVVKVSKNGTLLWEKTLGTVQDETGTGLCPGPDGGYIACGTTRPDVCVDSTIGDIGSQDCMIYVLDSAGNILSSKIFGGTEYDFLTSIVPYLNGYVAAGASDSYTFTEGSTYGNFDTSSMNPDGGGAYVSYIDYWPLSTIRINKKKEYLSLYPNPSAGNVRVILPANEEGDISIINSIGQIIYNRKTGQHEAYADVQAGAWPGGIYLVMWRGADGTVLTNKLIKN